MQSQQLRAIIVDDEEKATKLANIAQHIKNEPVDIILAGSTLPVIVDKKIDTIIEALETIDKKKLNSNDLAHYQREIQKAFDTNKKGLEDLSKAIDTFSTKDKITEAAKTLKEGDVPKTDIASLSGEKQWAYFGGAETLLGTDEKADELKEAIKTPVNLFDTKEKIDKLFENMKKFMIKKSEIPVEKKKPVIPIADSE